jgi:hypothetical protein
MAIRGVLLARRFLCVCMMPAVEPPRTGSAELPRILERLTSEKIPWKLSKKGASSSGSVSYHV